MRIAKRALTVGLLLLATIQPAPAFVPERNEIWYTDANYGFYALRVTNGVWPHP